jgi:uncharacterized protein YndB with AHSA1/START domain
MDDEQADPPVGTLQRWVRMRRRLTAAPERVFRAWADPEELARWFPEQVEGGLSVGSRSVLVWSERRVWWDVVEANPSRSFVFWWPWFPDDGLVTTVRVTIEALGVRQPTGARRWPVSDRSAEWARCVGEVT